MKRVLTAAIILAVVTFALFPATQWLRNIIQARRERESGIAGTQDIVMWATGIGCGLVLATAIVMYFAVAALRERIGE